MATILQGLVSAIVTAFGTLIGALPRDIAGAVKDMLIVSVTSGGTTTEELSVFGLLIAIVAGCSLAFACVRFITGLIRHSIAHR